MKVVKAPLKDVFSEDMTKPFWKSIKSNPLYPKFVEEIEHIMKESKKHGEPFNDIKMKTFDTFEQVEDMNGCMKRPIVVHAKKIDEEFRVNTLEGNYKQGKPGDYLMRGIDGELYICDAAIFEKTYDWV